VNRSILDSEKQHLAELLEAIQRCIYFLDAFSRKLTWPLKADLLETQKKDVDLGFRLALAGHQSMYIPDAVVHHLGSASTGGRHSDFSLYHGHRNLVWAFVKNMPGGLFWLLLPYHFLLNLATIVYFSLRGKGAVIFQAKWDAIKGIPKIWKKRQMIQKQRKASLRQFWRILDKRLFLFRRF
jgi:hypothetical protein